MKSKIIAIAMCMVLTMMPMTAFAAAPETAANDRVSPNAATLIDISGPECTITYNDEVMYTGMKPTAFDLGVSILYNGQPLFRDAHYTVTCNIMDQGYYPEGLQIKGVGGCTGTLKLPVTIKGKKKQTDLSNATVNYTEAQAYTGSAVEPEVTVVHDGKTLIKGTDYTVSYKDVIYPGTYSDVITITGTNNYKGTITKSVTIKDPVFKTEITKVSTAKNDPYIEYSAADVPGADKITYAVRCQVDKNTTPWKTVAAAATGTKVTAEALAGKTSYAVEVTPTVVLNGKTFTGTTVTKYINMQKPPAGAICSGEELIEKINANPKGSYYLTGNITLPVNAMVTETFKGTLDGKGYTIKGYTATERDKYARVGLFAFADGATFKNIKMTGVNINLNVDGGAYVGILTSNSSTSTKFQNIQVSGKVNVVSVSGSDGTDLEYGGITSGSGTFTNCKSSVNVTLKHTSEYSGVGAVGIGSYGTFTNCTNTGNITVTGNLEYYAASACGIAGYAKKATNCKNSGKITVKSGNKYHYMASVAAGIAESVEKATNCKNTGAITVNSQDESGSFSVSGIAATTTGATDAGAYKCSNTATIKFTGKTNNGEMGGVIAAGSAYQSYNKGKVTATVTKAYDYVEVGGVCGDGGTINCYNTGAVYLSGKGYVGGLIGNGQEARCTYNTGKVTGVNKATKGAIIGQYTGM